MATTVGAVLDSTYLETLTIDPPFPRCTIFFPAVWIILIAANVLVLNAISNRSLGQSRAAVSPVPG